MLRYVARRLVIMFATLFVIITVTFFISKALPGTPFADDKLTPQSREVLFAKYGLDQPLIVQYAKYMAQVAQGNLGDSFYFESRPVTQIILEQAPVSAFIGIQAVIMGLIPGLIFGVAAALRHNSVIDYTATAIAVAGISVPSFVLAPIMQYWIGFKWGLLPIAFFDSWAHSIMPSVALAVFVVAIVARYVRSEMLEVLGQDYVTLAKAKGLSYMTVVGRHVLRNSLIPVGHSTPPSRRGDRDGLHSYRADLRHTRHRHLVRAVHPGKRLRDDTGDDNILFGFLYPGLPGAGHLVRVNRPQNTGCMREG